jgi:hypothetical protein
MIACGVVPSFAAWMGMAFRVHHFHIQKPHPASASSGTVHKYPPANKHPPGGQYVYVHWHKEAPM